MCYYRHGYNVGRLYEDFDIAKVWQPDVEIANEVELEQKLPEGKVTAFLKLLNFSRMCGLTRTGVPLE